jgi:hypothetical protein
MEECWLQGGDLGLLVLITLTIAGKKIGASSAYADVAAPIMVVVLILVELARYSLSQQ